jgi:hypothetical protein
MARPENPFSGRLASEDMRERRKGRDETAVAMGNAMTAASARSSIALRCVDGQTWYSDDTFRLGGCPVGM